MKRIGTFFAFALALVTGTLAAPTAEVEPRQSGFQSQAITNFTEPWALAFLPDKRILVTEKKGQLRLVDPATRSKGTIIGVPAVRYSGQGGLGDVAIHPNFAQNSLIYISYAEAASDSSKGRAVVARGKLVLNNRGGGVLSNVEVIWRQSQNINVTGHYSHRILFEPGDANATLWISSGEREQFHPAQSMTTNLGKIIRLKDDGKVAPGNPFIAKGQVAAQVWALGVRNPLGIDFDEDGRLWEVEMGPRGGDEINLIEKGGNYGWPVVSQGNHYNGTKIPNHDTRPEFIAPKVSWNPVISPTSLIIYKGDLFRDWKGNALISTLGARSIVRVEISGNTAREAQRHKMDKRLRCIRQSADGALWVLEDGKGGRLLKLTP